MMSTAVSFENPFRPIYESYAAMCWLAAALLVAVFMATSDFPGALFVPFLASCAMMFGWRAVEALRLYRRQANLSSTSISFMTREELRAKCERRAKSGAAPAIFLGYGFTWTQEHTQLAHTIYRQDSTKLVPPDDEDLGQPWIHGIGVDKEREIWLPIDHTAGHTLLVGTTRAGKTRELDLIVDQAVARGEAVIIWDPKGDVDLKRCAERACKAAGRPNDYVFFHAAFPESSWIIDPLANFKSASELATRVASLIPSETGADPFTAHSQMVLTNLCGGLLLVNTKPTLALLKRYVDSGPEGLVVSASEAYFEKHVQDWRAQAEPYKRRGNNARDYALAYINYYREAVQRAHPSTILEGLYSDFEHDKAHQQKMTASLTPVLTMLTTGHVGALLSPNVQHDDNRPITDFARIIRNQQVCYIGLDNLSDNMVGSAIGSMFVSDLTAVAGARYNYESIEDAPAVNLIIDEAAELVSDKMIQLLNKSGGAKFRLVLATQTFADFATRVGSQDKARQILGNCNNVIALRIIDGETQEYVTESLPETYVRHIEYTQATSTDNSKLLHFGYRMNESLKETQVPLVPAQMFGCLPNLQSFGRVSGGHLVKLRSPILKD